MICAKYADNLIERFKNYRGRIGTHCNVCEAKDCLHHKDKMTVEEFALQKTEEK